MAQKQPGYFAANLNALQPLRELKETSNRALLFYYRNGLMFISGVIPNSPGGC